MQIYISLSNVYKEALLLLEDVIYQIRLYANPQHYSLEYHDRAEPYKKLLPYINKAEKDLREGKDLISIINYLKKYIITGIERNALNKALRLLQPDQNEPNSLQALYKRTRYLWKHHHTQFNDWELSFIKSIGDQLAKNKILSDKQKAALDKAFNKYKVPYNAEASEDFL